MEARLQVAVRGLDRAILVADAGVVAGWLHAVVAAELGIARGFSRSVGAVRRPTSRETAGRVVAVAHRIAIRRSKVSFDFLSVSVSTPTSSSARIPSWSTLSTRWNSRAYVPVFYSQCTGS